MDFGDYLYRPGFVIVNMDISARFESDPTQNQSRLNCQQSMVSNNYHV